MGDPTRSGHAGAPNHVRPGPARRNDRRTALRYRSVLGRAWLGWKTGQGFEYRAAWVIDVSAGGCLVASDGPPPPGRPVYLRLADVALPEWFEARVLEARAGQANVCAVRLTFAEGCPYDLFMGLAFGRFRSGR